MTFVYDIVNLQFVLIIYFIIVIYFRLDNLRSFLVAAHLIAIFFLNDVLFDSSYWPDQNKYYSLSNGIRNQIISFEKITIGTTMKVWLPSFIFSISPIPFINSIQSLAMINFLFYFGSFLFLKKKGISSYSVDFFYLFYPSFLLYSSLALKETLVVFLMIVCLYFLVVEEKIIIAFIISLPLAIIKIQNFLILILSYVVYIFIKKGSVLRYLIIFGAGLLVIIFGNHTPLISFFIERIDYYRWNLIAENFGYNWDLMANYDYQPFEGGLSMIPLLVKSFLYMLFKPFPWEATNLVQLIQSVENIFILALLLWVLRKKVLTHIIRRKLIFLNILLILSMTIYGLVTFNFGTAARFRFPFIVVYIVFYFYLLRTDKIISQKLSQDYSSTPAISLKP